MQYDTSDLIEWVQRETGHPKTTVATILRFAFQKAIHEMLSKEGDELIIGRLCTIKRVIPGKRKMRFYSDKFSFLKEKRNKRRELEKTLKNKNNESKSNDDNTCLGR